VTHKTLCLQCNARWVLEQHWQLQLSRQEFALTKSPHRAARRCSSPLFVWQSASGLHVHVGSHAGLYMDLVVLIRSLEESIKVLAAQRERIARYNEARVAEGRFLFGHAFVDEARGGVFVVDVSAAQPQTAADFAVQQLAQLLDHWCAPQNCKYYCATASHSLHVLGSIAGAARAHMQL
jgi:hypothetical protein